MIIRNRTGVSLRDLAEQKMPLPSADSHDLGKNGICHFLSFGENTLLSFLSVVARQEILDGLEPSEEIGGTPSFSSREASLLRMSFKIA